MKLETSRIILRPWGEKDARTLYEYAKDERVGPIAGWPVHTSVENSRDIILNVLSIPFTYAIVLRETNTIVGCISLMIGKQSHLQLPEKEAEIGYWLGVPFWGQGIMPEVVQELMRYGFEELHMHSMWCGYYEGNEKSHRVQEKCGFVFQYTLENVRCPLMNETRTEHISLLQKEVWQKHLPK